MAVVNQYSFVWASLLAIGLVALLLVRRRAPARLWLALVAIALGLASVYAMVRPTPADPAASDRLAAAIGTGIPVLVELQSPY